jgi:uncharacterized membrane protein
VIAGRPAAWRYGLIVLLVGGYAALVHYSNSNPSAKTLGAVLAITPVAAIGVGLAWRSAYRPAAIAIALFLGALIVTGWRVLESRFSLVYLLEDVMLYGLLCFAFARSLAQDRQPLCTYWASLAHGTLPPVVARYTRKVTAAWAVLFSLIVATSTVLYVWAPLQVWSAFANFLTLPLIVLMFVAEYALRRKVLPSSHRTGLIRSVRAFLEASRAARVVRP